jgi:hypothetical protein
MTIPKVFVPGERLFASDLNDNFDFLDTGLSQAGGARGNGDKIFWENDQTVTGSYTITTGQNAMTAGPVAIDSGVTVTVPSGSTWTVV